MSGEMEALRWVFEVAGEYLQPWPAWTEYGQPQREGFHCWGCDGEFISVWPAWVKPTDETFPHKPGCKYMTARALLRPADGESA